MPLETWGSVEVGGGRPVHLLDLLFHQKYRLASMVPRLFALMKPVDRTRIDLVLLSASEASQAAKHRTRGNIFASREKFGLVLCPPETPAQVLLELGRGVIDAIPTKRLYFAMEPVDVPITEGRPLAYDLYLEVRGCRAGIEANLVRRHERFQPDSAWIFARAS